MPHWALTRCESSWTSAFCFFLNQVAITLSTEDYSAALA
jgi:hypothetical protein